MIEEAFKVNTLQLINVPYGKLKLDADEYSKKKFKR
jgi:hypothetical protein